VVKEKPKAFVHRHSSWCESVALLNRGESVIGVIRVPCGDETFAVLKGAGEMLNSEPLKLHRSMTLQNSLTGIGANQTAPPDRIGTLPCGA